MARFIGRRARPGRSAAILALVGLLAASTLASAATLSQVYFHGSRNVRVVALTFDDGWSPANCAATDRILQANGVTATFFPNARYVRLAPALWKQLATRYPFGDHTTDHVHMDPLSYATQFYQINSDRLIIESITRVPLIRVFRPPWGEFTNTTLTAAATAGFPVTMLWDVNVYDVTAASDATLLAQATSGSNGSVITAHCGPDATVRILPAVIAYYRSHGFRFVTVPQLLAGLVPPVATPSPLASASIAPSTAATPAPSSSSIASSFPSPSPSDVPIPVQDEINAGALSTLLYPVALLVAAAALVLAAFAWRRRVRPRKDPDT
jgi:peptidoglycan/xylan/chitin deacetylase (PgdA/CDA1 family)